LALDRNPERDYWAAEQSAAQILKISAASTSDAE